MILSNDQILIIFLIDGLCWLLVKWQILLLSFFLLAWTRETFWQKFWKCSYTEEKQVELGKSVAHIKLNFNSQIKVQVIEEN